MVPALAVCAPLTVAMTAGAAAAAGTGSAAATHDHGRSRGPVYVPYFETWTKDKIPAVARASGARYLTLAFLQTPKRGSCSVAWNGDRRQMVKPGGRYAGQIAGLRAMGGDVVPSFGGYSADQDGTEVADSCASVAKIAKAYESVVTAYGVTRLDMDVEARSLDNKAGIARRSEALRLLQGWAARTHHRVQIIFTLGVEPWGLPANCLAVLKSAVAHGVRFAVNIMAFDYYIKASRTGLDMGTAALQALRGTHGQLERLYLGRSQRRLWAMEGVSCCRASTTTRKDRGDLPERRPAGGEFRACPPAAADLDLGDPAGQRRLPGNDRQQLLLGHQAAEVGVQPPARGLPGPVGTGAGGPAGRCRPGWWSPPVREARCSGAPR
jgi:chitinase